MDAFQLDERKKSILLEVVNDYIQKAEPVGSRSVAKKHSEKLSPATIRNVMADLEELGYLHQPHTSAGRVPTDQGYRFYVDTLLAPRHFLKDAEALTEALRGVPSDRNLQKVLENACSDLSQSSHQTGLVMLPSFQNTIFKHIEFIKVDADKALAVFYSEMGVLQNKIIPIEKAMSQDQLTSISHFLNEEFTGKSIQSIRAELLHRLKHEREHYNQLMKKAMDLSNRIFAEEEEGSLLVQGAMNLLDHPEFTTDLDQIKVLLKTLEDKTKLVQLLDLCLKHDGMTILIGEENSNEEMQGCSLIAQNYSKGDEKLGTVAVFGPKRMDYKKIIAIVNQTAKSVSTLISKDK